MGTAADYIGGMGNGEDIQTGRETAGSDANAGAPGDAWLERRLRVFERALNGLEEKQERGDRAHTAALGRLEERVTFGENRLDELETHLGESHRALEKAIAEASKKLHTPVADIPPAKPAPRFETEVEAPAPISLPVQALPENAAVEETEEAVAAAKPEREFLAAARRSAIDAAAQETNAPKPRRSFSFTKPLLIGIVTLVVSLTGTAFFLRHAPGSNRVVAAPVGSGAVVRHVAVKPEQRLEVLADAGSRRAMHALAMQFVEKNDMAGAARWFSRAASLGYGDSQFNLAILYERGEGVRQSLEQAYIWYTLAAAGGDREAATRMQALQTQLQPDQLHAADLAVHAFTPESTNAAADNTPLKVRS